MDSCPFHLRCFFFFDCRPLSFATPDKITQIGICTFSRAGYMKAERLSKTGAMTTTLSEILETFEFLDDWEDRYKYLIDLGKELPELADDERTDTTKVRGCVSQVWLITTISPGPDGAPVLTFRGDSDALIVQGLVAIVTALFNGKTAQDILDTDVEGVFAQLGLQEHLTPQRSNGLKSMVGRIRNDAQQALAAA